MQNLKSQELEITLGGSDIIKQIRSANSLINDLTGIDIIAEWRAGWDNPCG